MDLNYSFLKDELALKEIRKHKWIESEKQKREIGFATAAVDWVKKYGQDWKTFRLGLKTRADIFNERRIHRRFTCQIPVQLRINGNLIMSYSDNMNLIGFSCALPQYISMDNKVEIVINFQGQRIFPSKALFRFKSKVLRFSTLNKETLNASYKAFFLFNDDTRKNLRTNSAVFGTGL